MFKASLIGKGINPEEYQAEYDRKMTGTSGGGTELWSIVTIAWGGGPGRGAPGSERGRDSWRGGAARGRGRSAPNHYGLPPLVPLAHVVSEQAYNTEVIDGSKLCGLTTRKSMKNTRVSCATYKAL